MKAMVFSLIVTLAGCSSSSSGSSSACGSIDGIYSITSTQNGGTCASTPPATADVSVQENNDGTATVFLPGITGGCPGKLQACALTANCELRDAAGKVVVSGAVSWTFTSSGLSGSESLGFHPPAKPTDCTGSYSDTGTKK